MTFFRPLSLTLLFGLFLVQVLHGQTPSGSDLLAKIDANITSERRIIVVKMIIYGRRASRTVTSKSYIQGDDQAFTEYLSPPREKGVKMLKLGDQLWTYAPSTDRTIKISGHMLRQSVMGSDLSYEDMMTDRKLQDAYRAQVIGSENMGERPCWVVDLSAAIKDVAYFSRKIWVDKERFIPLREERYSKSGKLLKTTDIKEVMLVDKRWMPRHLIFKDVLKNGKGTEYFLESIELDVPISEHLFTKASLRK